MNKILAILIVIGIMTLPVMASWDVSEIEMTQIETTQSEQKACVGESVSAISTQFHKLFGKGVSILAQYPELIPGNIGQIGDYDSLGKGIQALRNGEIPDFIVVLPDGSKVLIENTCND